MGFTAERVKSMNCPECGHEFAPADLAPMADAPCPGCQKMIRIPARFGKFMLYRRLGIGFSGAVFEAFDTQLQRQVALKILKSDEGAEHIARQCLSQSRTVASLHHQNIVRVYDLGQFKDQHYIERELVTGGSARDYLKAEKKPGELEIIDLAIGVVDGLNTAAAAKLIHTNVEPGTILLDEQGQPKLIDFGAGAYTGVSKDEATGKSHYYIAPEVVRGAEADSKSDMYNLGATMFHLLCGRPPFRGKTRDDTMKLRVVADAPPMTKYRRGLTPTTVALVGQLLEIEPRKRFDSYEDLMDALFEAREAAERNIAADDSEATSALAAASMSASSSSTGSVDDLAGASARSSSARSSSVRSSTARSSSDRASRRRVLAGVAVGGAASSAAVSSSASGGASAGRVARHVRPKPSSINPLIFIVPGAGAAIALLTVVVALNMGGPNSDPPIINETEQYVDTDDSQELIQQPVYNPPPVIAAKIKVPPIVRPKPAPTAKPAPSAKPVPVTPTGGMNLARGKPATASSSEKDRKPAMSADGNNSTRWCAVDGNANHWWQVDLGKVEKLGSCHIRWEFNGRLYKYRIEGSTDNKNWKTLVDYSGNKNNKKQLQKHNLGGQSARYIRIKPTALPAASWFSFFEFEVFGAK